MRVCVLGCVWWDLWKCGWLLLVLCIWWRSIEHIQIRRAELQWGWKQVERLYSPPPLHKECYERQSSIYFDPYKHGSESLPAGDKSSQAAVMSSRGSVSLQGQQAMLHVNHFTLPCITPVLDSPCVCPTSLIVLFRLYTNAFCK